MIASLDIVLAMAYLDLTDGPLLQVIGRILPSFG
jgi:hypothetical protein